MISYFRSHKPVCHINHNHDLYILKNHYCRLKCPNSLAYKLVRYGCFSTRHNRKLMHPIMACLWCKHVSKPPAVGWGAQFFQVSQCVMLFMLWLKRVKKQSVAASRKILLSNPILSHPARCVFSNHPLSHQKTWDLHVKPPLHRTG